MAPVSGLRQRGMLQGIGALVCISMLVTAFVLAAAADAPQSTQPRHQVDLSGLLTPTDETDPGVRRLPIPRPARACRRGLPQRARPRRRGQGPGGHRRARRSAGFAARHGRAAGHVPRQSRLLQRLEPLPVLPLRVPGHRRHRGCLARTGARGGRSDGPLGSTPGCCSSTPCDGIATPPTRMRGSRGRASPTACCAGLTRRRPAATSALDLFFVMSMGFAPHILDVEAEARRALAALSRRPDADLAPRAGADWHRLL